MQEWLHISHSQTHHGEFRQCDLMRDKGLQTWVVVETFKEDTNLTRELKFDKHTHTHPHIQMLNSKILKYC